METYRFYQQQIAQCDQQIEGYLSRLETRVDPEQTPLPPSTSRRKKPGRNHPDFDLRTHLYRISGADFTQIEGIQALTVQTILSEVGLDPSKFSTVKHFTPWMGLCPDNRIIGGLIKSSKTRKVKNRAADAFRRASQALAHSGGPLGAYYRRMRVRMGPAQANTATAHKRARIFYRLWKEPTAYDLLQLEQHEQQRTQRTLHYLRKKTRSLGFDLVPQTVAAQ